MPQSLSKLWIHIIFSTKKRYPFLKDLIIQQKVHAYIKAICCKQNCETLIVGGIEDHIHLLIELPRTVKLSDIVEKIKKSSSKWIKTISASDEELNNFYWQRGYAAFSVSHSNLKSVEQYIRNQYKHHQKKNFQEEVREFLIKNNISYDEKYMWD